MGFIDLKNVTKEYCMGDITVRALAGVNLAIQEGEFVAITGPSGSGKSTLMNIIGRLDHPTGGSYCLAGEEVAILKSNQLAGIRNKQIGFVFQNFNLLSRMSAPQNVVLPLIYAGVNKQTRVELAKQALASVGLEERMHHCPNELSGGQRHGVAIARALINNPSILIADEPTGNLDTKSSAEIMEIFCQLNQQGRIVIMVTHEADIAAYAHRVIQVRDGNIITDAFR